MKLLKTREAAANILLVSLSIAFLWFFSCIWVYGSHYIQEPNPLILICEVAGILLVLCFATRNLIKLAQERRNTSEN